VLSPIIFCHILFVDGLFRGKVREDDGYQ